MEGLLGKFIQSVEPGAAACEDKSGGDLAIKPGALQIVANQRKQFHGTRFDDVRQHVREDGPWRTVATLAISIEPFSFISAEAAQPWRRLSLSASGMGVRKPTARSFVK